MDRVVTVDIIPANEHQAQRTIFFLNSLFSMFMQKISAFEEKNCIAMASHEKETPWPSAKRPGVRHSVAKVRYDRLKVDECDRIKSGKSKRNPCTVTHRH
jgi:hypothetical protein